MPTKKKATKLAEQKEIVSNSPSSNEEAYFFENSATQQNDSGRILLLHGEVNEASISAVIAQLIAFANESTKPVYLVISTYGGSVDEMFSLYDVMKFLPCPIYTIALGKVMSAGVILLASGVKGKRMIGASARIMIHPPSGVVEGNIFEMQPELSEFKRLHKLMEDTMIRETKMSRKEIQDIMKSGHDFYLTPEEAVKLGIVDKIIGK